MTFKHKKRSSSNHKKCEMRASFISFYYFHYTNF
nr:MAG TPA: hypothetical protein [Caudoviricetes sp.]